MITGYNAYNLLSITVIHMSCFFSYIAIILYLLCTSTVLRWIKVVQCTNVFVACHTDHLGTDKVYKASSLCCSAFPTNILASDFALLRLLTWWFHVRTIRFTIGERSCSQQLHPRGMLCLVLSVLPHQCYSSEVDSRQNYSRVHTSTLLNLSLRHCNSTLLFRDLDVLVSRHVNDDSSTN